MTTDRSDDETTSHNRALVIGASGGIGAALCAALSERGYDVTGLSRTADGIDFAEPDSVTSRLEALSGPFGMILVASGVLAPEGARPEKSLAEIDASRMAEVMTANAIGPALVLRHAPRLLPRNGRSVVGVLTARVGSIG
ncbi:MAG: C factor, cell signaling protein, partial [Pelagibaca sp.]|nr:C factor, cell signaling protein [Pelagibaca sp.]